MKIRTTLMLTIGTYLASSFTAAHAYLDPGTGSLIIQGLIASIAAASAVIGLYWQNVKNYFKRDNSSTEEEQKGD